MNEHGGYFGKEANQMMDFSVNINPLGVPQKLMDVLVKELPYLIRYPEIDGITAKKTIATYLNKEVDELILGNGATELIYLFARAIAPKKVLIIQPTFTEYERAFQLSGSQIHYFSTDEKDDFKINKEALFNTIGSLQPEVIVLCNPNNPTGLLYHPEELLPLLEVVKENRGYFFVDESFIDFTEKPSLINCIEEYPLFLLRSMTKTYGIPGLRLGYGLGNRGIIQKLNSIKEPWTINSLALKAVPILLEDTAYFNDTIEWYREEKDFLWKALSTIDGMKVFPSDGNFFLCKLKHRNGSDLKNALAKKGIYIRTCTDFKGLSDQFIRLAVRSREENQRLIHGLREMEL
ncbi:threonine-phosphate decarboxylase CobD [Alkaliphilus oremlandii]|uniref:threonine-phosphate decarboxylase n=1 Tax=Alkaliphilus oremlandii (strain OhILAs) TaxID=350688 RepID=A8MIW4_ALKOO|nr:threonine-phosphate decarboxylase CobD [Alkaliphilus oremlandii]ABW19746.1 putative L-threonine-O-3-phosphate decarboxylase [Alkaliphilus oremlandii OhILAs]